MRVLAGEIIQPNSVKVIRGEGMPIYKNPIQKGDLLIFFDVVFPTRLDRESIERILAALPKDIGSVKAQKHEGSLDGENINFIPSLTDEKSDNLPNDAIEDEESDDEIRIVNLA
jgi:DnaJ family protein A protein 2